MKIYNIDDIYYKLTKVLSKRLNKCNTNVCVLPGLPRFTMLYYVFI